MLRNTPESQQIQSNALTYEKLRSLNAFFHSLDRPSKDGFSKVSTQLETLSPESHGLGFCDRRLFELEKVGSFFQAAQNWLHEEKYLVEVMRKQTQNHLRPVSRLPNEVLSEIFLLSMDPDSKSVWDEPFLSTCSRWRKCAVATPAVWRWLYIHENTHPSELIVVLARSHNAPLDVTIEFPSIDDDGPVPELKISHFSLLERLLSHSVWRIVSLTTVDAPMLGWMPISILRTNSLRKLHYDFSYYQEPESLIPTAGSPLSEINFGRLQLLKLTGGVLHSVSIQSPAFASLSHIQFFSAVSIDTAWRIFVQCSQLETVEWQADTNGDLSWDDYLPAAYGLGSPELPRLKKLKLEDDACALFLPAAVAPNVETIEIRTPPPTILPRLLSALQRQESSHISTFWLWGIPQLLEEDITTILALPSLESLASDSWDSQALRGVKCLTNFEADEENRWFWKCPRLRRLDLGFESTLTRPEATPGDIRRTLLLLLEELVADRAKEENSSLRVRVHGIRLELPANDDPGHWAAVHVVDPEPASTRDRG